MGVMPGAERVFSYAFEHVGPEHYEFARSHINCLLGAAGLVPSDNEGGQCLG